MDNKKIVELADNFHAEINSTKNEFTKKIDSRIDEIEKKVTSSGSNESLNMENYNRQISIFSHNFSRIKDAVKIQNNSINKLALMYKILTFVAIAYIAVILIAVFTVSSSHKDKKDKNSAVSSSSSKASTVASKTTSSVEPSPSSQSSGKVTPISDYSDLIKNYKQAYVKAVNSKDRSDLDKFISSSSSLDKHLTTKLTEADKQKLKLDLKDVKVDKVEDKDGYIYIYTSEAIGIKSSDSDSFKYDNYKVKYTVRKSGNSYVFENQENL